MDRDASEDYLALTLAAVQLGHRSSYALDAICLQLRSTYPVTSPLSVAVAPEAWRQKSH